MRSHRLTFLLLSLAILSNGILARPDKSTNKDDVKNTKTESKQQDNSKQKEDQIDVSKLPKEHRGLEEELGIDLSHELNAPKRQPVRGLPPKRPLPFQPGKRPSLNLPQRKPLKRPGKKPFNYPRKKPGRPGQKPFGPKRPLPKRRPIVPRLPLSRPNTLKKRPNKQLPKRPNRFPKKPQGLKPKRPIQKKPLGLAQKKPVTVRPKRKIPKEAKQVTKTAASNIHETVKEPESKDKSKKDANDKEKKRTKKDELSKADQYAAPVQPVSYNSGSQPQVIIRQAGPSQHYGWVGHGRHAPLNIPNPFPSNLPKWIPMGNNVFEAGLLYSGGSNVPSTSSSYNANSVSSSAVPLSSVPTSSYNAPSSGSYNAPSSSLPAPSVSIGSSYNAGSVGVSSSYNGPSSISQPVSSSYNTGPALGVGNSPSYSSVSSGSSISGGVGISNSYNANSVQQPSLVYNNPQPASFAPAVSSYQTPSPTPSYGSGGGNVPVSFGTFTNTGLPAIQQQPPTSSYNVQQGTSTSSGIGIQVNGAGYQSATISSGVSPAPTNAGPAPVYVPKQPDLPNTNYERAPVRIFDPATKSFVYVDGYDNAIAQEENEQGSVNVHPQSVRAIDNRGREPEDFEADLQLPSIPVLRGDQSPPPDPPVSLPTIASHPATVNPITAEEFREGSIQTHVQPERAIDNRGRVPEDFQADLLLSSFGNDQVQQDRENAFEVPIQVEEVLSGGSNVNNYDNIPVIPADSDKQTSAEQGQDDEAEVFYIFYENEDDVKPTEVYRGQNPPPDFFQGASGDNVEYVVQEPAHSQFSPPDEDDIRTIYVPLENAINVPEHYTLSLGTSFGYNKDRKNANNKARQTRPGLDPSAPNQDFPNFGSHQRSNAPSYDNPISSYDAPIYNDNSYTAQVDPREQQRQRQRVQLLGNEGSGELQQTSETRLSRGRTRVRKVRRPAVPLDEDFEVEDTSLFISPPNFASGIPYGTRLEKRKPYTIIDN